MFTGFLKNVQEKLCNEVSLCNILQITVSSPACFKILENFEITSTVEFLIKKQVLSGSLENSNSKQLFGKLPGRSSSVLKKGFTLDVLLGSLQILSRYFFEIHTN